VLDTVARFPESGFRNPAIVFKAIKDIWETWSYPAPRSSDRIFKILTASPFRLKILSARHGRSEFAAAHRMRAS
jgi:hypothetical protein